MKKRMLGLAVALVVCAMNVCTVSAKEVVPGDFERIRMEVAAKQNVHAMVQYYNTYPSLNWIKNLDDSDIYPPDEFGNLYYVTTQSGMGATSIQLVSVVNPEGAVQTLAQYTTVEQAQQMVAGFLGNQGAAAPAAQSTGYIDGFDPVFYYNAYPDLQAVVAADNVDALYQHYLNFGKAEGRVCHQ